MVNTESCPGIGRAAASARFLENASPKSSCNARTPPVFAASGARRDAKTASRPHENTSTVTRRDANCEKRACVWVRGEFEWVGAFARGDRDSKKKKKKKRRDPKKASRSQSCVVSVFTRMISKD